MRAEFQFINDIKERFSLSHIGDDCAVLPKDEVSDLLITADLLLENVDFRLEWAKPADIGYKSLAVSLSDIAAMGGTPTYALVSIAVPDHIWNSGFVDEFYEGWHSLAEEFNVELVGGDVSSANGGLIIDSIVLGDVAAGKAIRRSGAKVGDHIYISGTIGAAAAGLRILEAESPKNAEILIGRQLRPHPQVELAKQLRELGFISSMIDVSDGISSDLSHICRSSQVGALVDAALLPMEPSIGQVFPQSSDQLDLALNGGEDFELLFTVPFEAAEMIPSGLCITRIGTITEPGKIELNVNGEVRDLLPQGFRHF